MHGERLARIQELTAMIEDHLQRFDRSETDAAELTNFGSLYRRVGKNLVIVGKKGMSKDVISDKLTRIAARQPFFEGVSKLADRVEPGTLGRTRDEFRKSLLNHNKKTGNTILGTVAKGSKGKRSYVNRAAVSGRGKSKMGLREIAHHEGFHNIPVVGRSEVAAHFVGGLRSKKGKLSVGEGLSRIGHAAATRPTRVAAEVAIAGGGIYGARKLMKRGEEKR
jgi:hypothetical protein